MTPAEGSFADAVGGSAEPEKRANETEVEAPAEQGAPASAGRQSDQRSEQHPDQQSGQQSGRQSDQQSGPPGPPGPPSDERPSTDEQGPDATESVSDKVEEVGPLESADLGAAAIEDHLAERTADLQRLQAEYANYRKRVERDRVLVAENATYKALTPIIEVLDAIDRAREAGEVEGGFKSVAEQLERSVASCGLVRFGEPGDAFDPNRHDALSHLGVDPEVTVTTVKVVAKAGYAIGDRVVRAAQVLVVDPAED